MYLCVTGGGGGGGVRFGVLCYIRFEIRHFALLLRDSGFSAVFQILK